jgi:hypothetical protein
MNECTRELVCDRTAYESPEARGDKQHNMHGLKNKMQILHVSLLCFKQENIFFIEVRV